jgi:hypothetical protein
MLVIDVSGSMGESWQGGVKLESARSAAHQILNMLEQESQLGRARHSVGLVPFTTDAWLEVPVSEDFDTLRAAVDSLSALDSTNIGAALEAANGAFDTVDPAERRIVLLLSDGMITEGPGPEEVLAGPVQEAAAAGICIYTIGFGDPGALDEPLLRQIAQESGCGEYFYATNVSELEGVYIRIRHVSTGNVLAEFSGTVAAGETVEAGSFDVEVGQEELVVSLHWPGSLLDLRLIDPRGRVVDEGYQGANLQVYQNLVYAVIEQPGAGTWQVGVYGREVPTGSESFSVLASARAGAAVPPQSGGLWIALVVLAVAGGAVAVYAGMARRGAGRRPRTGVAPIGTTASLTVESGPAARQRWAVSSVGAEIGRGSSCTVRLRERAVSRLHARLRYAEGAWFVQDQGSAGGTYVNGERVPAARLKSGDRITIGGTTLLFQEE